MGSLATPPHPHTSIPHTTLANGVRISRIVSGLWQLAGGHDTHVNLTSAAGVMADLVAEGFDTFDMADHYGDAELVVGRYYGSQSKGQGGHRMTAFSKWCPEENGDKSFENAARAVERCASRMGVQRVELLQCEHAILFRLW